MQFRKIHNCRGWLLVVLMSLLCGPLAAQPPVNATDKPTAMTPAELAAAMADYRVKLEAYRRAWHEYEAVAGKYWDSIAAKRRHRVAKRRSELEMALGDYVLTQPPAYSGPPEPINPSIPVPPPRPRKYLAVVADFLKCAKKYFKFVPQQPRNEIEFKRAYAKVAKAAGLTKEQAVRIYGFEAGGNGLYDVQAGLEYPTPDAHAISTALGYNQLLNTNTLELLAEKGARFIKVLEAKAAALSGKPKSALDRKIAILRRMIAFSKSVPDEWSAHERLANTPKGLGIHALNLDIDIGPLLQTQKLLDSVIFARRKGYSKPLTAAELEMMNLTGDGNGIDMVLMPAAMRQKVPTANFFQPGGYERNPVAIRHNTVAALIAATDAKMDQETVLQGAKDLAAAF